MQEGAVAAIARLGVSDTEAWQQTSEQIATISLLNLASVAFFNDHVYAFFGINVARAAGVRRLLT